VAGRRLRSGESDHGRGTHMTPLPHPPPAPRERIRGSRVAAGIGVALGAHFLTVGAMVVGIATDNSDFAAGAGLVVLLAGQAVVFLVCIILGIVLTARREPGFGVGLLIGWAIGVIVAPLAGFGICVWAVNNLNA
jgi:hypothetical protein